MSIADKMLGRLARALKQAGDMFNLDDIQKALRLGTMQGHVENDTWAITQIHDWPRRRTANILFVVGDMEDALKLEAKIEEWALGVGANRITAVGRDGWWEFRTPGWKKVGTLYSKDI